MAKTYTDTYYLVADLIDRALEKGDIILSIEAQEMDELLREQFPDAWLEFVTAESHRLFYEHLRQALTVRKRRVKTYLAAKEFAEAAKNGEVGIYRNWRCCVDHQNTMRAIGEMTASDHNFVADRYAREVKEARMLEAFHRAVAKRIGKGTLEKVVPEAEFGKLWESLVKS